ncbi:hypothetical protein CERSUDRAFT_89853 [Gelatoporia subvermispora B]|uniref:Uncharacterized protein n=1 Tax=Ceriporiopsis subvermispora (strain B) TaxID=914234 RepID=M2RQV1_CERS8|nr:hypothetical protein CERSUDRAFT_89853 [Gelatoporia subvermispora B]
MAIVASKTVRGTSLTERLRGLDAKLVDIGKREEEARSLLEYILSRKLALQSERAEVHRQLDPFNWLPTELLAYIFHAVLECENISCMDALERPWVFHQPVVLSHVCRRWRIIALSTSRLWSSVLANDMPSTEELLQRSGCSPVDIFYCDRPEDDPAEATNIQTLVASVSPRWRRLYCLMRSPRSVLQLLSTLRSDSPFPLLENLSLQVYGMYIDSERPALASLVSTQCHFPTLHDLSLSGISLDYFPFTPMPTLQNLRLNYPVKDAFPQNILLHMSAFWSLMAHAPNLRSLVLNDASPVLDISVFADLDQNKLTDQKFCSEGQVVHPIVLQQLDKLVWFGAPPKDLWFLFYIIRMPRITRLDLILDHCVARWLAKYTGYYTSVDTTRSMHNIPSDLVLDFDELESLMLVYRDNEGVTVALKKMRFPTLKELEIARPSPDDLDHSLFPRHESIFREPRLPSLTHLTLRWVNLQPEEARTMLQYMPALTHLTLEGCGSSGKLICLLSGGTCTGKHQNVSRKWVCPRLEELVIEDSRDVKFRCLSQVLRERRHAGEDRTKNAALALDALNVDQNSPLARKIKPLRRRALQTYPNGSPGSPLSTNILGLPSSSTVAGWGSHEISRPRKLLSLQIRECTRISEVEAMSLMGDEWGVEEVVWEA